jgi:hypothetical protein
VDAQPKPCSAARPAILDKAIILSYAGAHIDAAQFADQGAFFTQLQLPDCGPAAGDKCVNVSVGVPTRT